MFTMHNCFIKLISCAEILIKAVFNSRFATFKAEVACNIILFF